MCLSVVGEIVELNTQDAWVNITGIQRKISIEWIESPQIGDKVLIHAGCAIAKLSEDIYEETVEALSLLEEALNG
jgi:hydrogenase expression/formation protein HypC